MKTVFNVCISLVCIISSGCNGEEKQADTRETSAETKYQNLLSKYEDAGIDTLFVYSPEYSEHGATGEYAGTALDSIDLSVFPEHFSEQYSSAEPEFFAVYKFPITENIIGLITRTPSEYYPSSVKLFQYDKQKQKIVTSIELAETFGDAGDYMNKSAWIFKDSTQKHMAFIHEFQGHDNQVDDIADTTSVEWNYYYLIDISGPKNDTVSKDEKVLVPRFKILLDKSQEY